MFIAKVLATTIYRFFPVSVYERKCAVTLCYFVRERRGYIMVYHDIKAMQHYVTLCCSVREKRGYIMLPCERKAMYHCEGKRCYIIL